MSFIFLLIGVIGVAGTCGALQLDNITLTHSIIQGVICLIVAGIGVCLSFKESDNYESEMY